MSEPPADPRRRDLIVKGLSLSLATAAVSPSASQPKAGTPIRQEISSMDSASLAKLEGAIKEMMDRSDRDARDPKGWLANAEPHNAFCATPGTNGMAQIHFCYWFLPWHRAYLAVTERKLREIAGDSTLCLPYWNWSRQRRIPDRYMNQASPLARALRFTPSRPLEDSEVDYLASDPAMAKLGVAALAATKFAAVPSQDRVTMARELRSSFGGVPRPNTANRFGNSRLEGTPHGPIHNYVGGVSDDMTRGGDMADFATAGRDPIFFAHHGNLDRIWEIWRLSAQHRATEPSEKAFLAHRFAFPWLDGTTVELTVEETLDTNNLGYQYDSLEVAGTDAAATASQETALGSGRLAPIAKATVQRPAMPEAAIQTARYSLVIEGVEAPQRTLTAGVYVGRVGAEANELLLVGSLSVVKSGQAFTRPDTVLTFDVTSALSAIEGPVSVQVIPMQLGGEARRPYQTLRYRAVRIVRD